MDDVRLFFARNGLYRSPDGRLLGGVCAGIGERVGLDPGPARLLTFLLLVLVPGSPLVLYPLLWFLLPLRDTPRLTGGYGAPPLPPR